MYAKLEMNQSRNSALTEIVKKASSDEDVNTIIEFIIKKTYQVIAVERVTLFIVDELRQELWCRYGMKE